MNSKADELTPTMRAEDILLGSLGYGEEAHIVSVLRTETGYRGVARWSDGEEFPFESDDALDELELWALELLASSAPSDNAASVPPSVVNRK
jgi:hypothetical protein